MQTPKIILKSISPCINLNVSTYSNGDIIFSTKHKNIESSFNIINNEKVITCGNLSEIQENVISCLNKNHNAFPPLFDLFENLNIQVVTELIDIDDAIDLAYLLNPNPLYETSWKYCEEFGKCNALKVVINSYDFNLEITDLPRIESSDWFQKETLCGYSLPEEVYNQKLFFKSPPDRIFIWKDIGEENIPNLLPYYYEIQTKSCKYISSGQVLVDFLYCDSTQTFNKIIHFIQRPTINSNYYPESQLLLDSVAIGLLEYNKKHSPIGGIFVSTSPLEQEIQYKTDNNIIWIQIKNSTLTPETILHPLIQQSMHNIYGNVTLSNITSFDEWLENNFTRDAIAYISQSPYCNDIIKNPETICVGDHSELTTL
ncbi:MAG: hypothetical protein HRU36_05765 [Rickettsiales bacterium]|nr:hypothetical protein [Rickettsiales bacterium]